MNPRAIAGSFGTPAYVYDRADVRRACAGLRRALPQPSVVYYSLKANPHPDVAAALAELGCRAEVSSVGEVETALAAGFTPPDILMTGPGKTRADVVTAVRRGVRRFSVDSPIDLDRVGEAAEEYDCAVDCLLRINADDPVPGMGLSMTGTASQFGADTAWVLAEPERFRDRGPARVTGLHLYMGTNIESIDVLARQLSTSIEVAGRLRSVLALRLSEVNLGGGFGLPYAKRGERPSFAGLATCLEPVLDETLPGWRDGAPVVTFESGRYLVGGCGTLVCQVTDVKVSKGRTFVILDSGVHHLGGMAGLRRLPRVVPDLLLPDAGDDWVDDCVVAGPLCTPLDTWSDGVRLPRFRPGDVVCVPNVGAYGLTASLLAFLGHSPAAEIVVDGEDVVSASRLALDRVLLGSSAQRAANSDREPTTERKEAPDKIFVTILRRHLRYLTPDHELAPDASLKELGLDSLEAVSVIFDIEEEFGITLPDSSLTAGTFETAADLWLAIDAARTAADDNAASYAATRSG